MPHPRADLFLVVFDDRHPADAVDALRMPQGKQRVVGLLAFALGDFIGDVVVHFFSLNFASKDFQHLHPVYGTTQTGIVTTKTVAIKNNQMISMRPNKS
jgi:hypothetical protein